MAYSTNKGRGRRDWKERWCAPNGVYAAVNNGYGRMPSLASLRCNLCGIGPSHAGGACILDA